MVYLLEKKYVPPDRPYSMTEIQEVRLKNMVDKNLYFQPLSYSGCHHIYFCKKYGKKYNEIKENKTTIDIGNCSVCWSLFNVDKQFKKIGFDLASEYADIISNDITFTHYELMLEKLFYNWLYNFEKKNNK